MPQTYRTYKEIEIPIACHAPREAVDHSPAESDPGARGKDTYTHRSISGQSQGCRVVYQRHGKLWYCTHPEHLKAGPKQGPCRHLQNVLFWLAYDEALATFRDASDADLAALDRYQSAIAAGVYGAVRGWEADGAALGDVIAERMALAEAA